MFVRFAGYQTLQGWLSRTLTARKLIITVAIFRRIGFSVRSNRSINSSNFSYLSVQVSSPGFEGRGYLLDVLDVFSDFLLFGLDLVQTSVDAVGQEAELLMYESPFFSPKFRWSDARTSSKASAIRRPGGCSGPP